MSTKKEPMTLTNLLEQKLQALYDIENELIKALPKMAKAATDKELKTDFTKHLLETKNQAKRLEEAFALFGVKPKKLKGDAIRGLIADAAWVIKNVKGKAALDANLIAAASYVEHYEMAGYISAAEWALELGLDAVAQLLQHNLAEEMAADVKLVALGRQKLNEKAI